MHAAYAGLTGY